MTDVHERWVSSRWPGYDVSSIGRMRGPRGILGLCLDTKGYLATGAYIGGKSRTIRVHVEVARAFLGPPPPGKQVAHNDGDRTNAALSNLSYKTRSENEADKIAHGTVLRGERNPQSKLTDEQADEIRVRVRRGEVQLHIAKVFGVSPALVCKIGKGKTRAPASIPIAKGE